MKYFWYFLGAFGAVLLGILLGGSFAQSTRISGPLTRGRFHAIEKEVKKEAEKAEKAKRKEIQELTPFDVRSRYASKAISAAGRDKRNAVRARLRDSASGTGGP